MIRRGAPRIPRPAPAAGRGAWRGLRLARRSRVALLGAGALLAGCNLPPPTDDVPPRPFTIKDLAKSDVDQITEIHLTQTRDHLATLTRKLYRRNPSAWRNAGEPSAEFVVQRIFRPPAVPDFQALGGRRGVEAIRLAFEPDYRGDRVLAFAAGLAAMVDAAYGDRREFYLTDSLDPQKLYNCARNIEVAAWLLRTRTGDDGRPLILGNSLPDEDVNLSFERLFGKLISLQDSLAMVVAERSNRTIRTVVQRMVGAVFLPI